VNVHTEIGFAIPANGTQNEISLLNNSYRCFGSCDVQNLYPCSNTKVAKEIKHTHKD